MDDFSRKADELLEKCMLVTNTVGSQIQGMNSSIVKMQEMNENMKEEGGKQIQSIRRKNHEYGKKNPGHGQKI